MDNTDPNFSRLDRKKKRRGDKILNALIAVVVAGIVITASIIFLGGNKDQSEEDAVNNQEEEQTENVEEQNKQEENNEEDDSASDEQLGTDSEESLDDEAQDESEEAETEVEITVDSNDEFVSQSIVNPGWQPIGTAQSGEHVSLYDGQSVDWQEKEQALAYATGLAQDNMIVWRLKNGGSPQKSIGIVSSNDKAEKYRVYLDWVDQEGWKPVKMDVLTTLDFNY